MTRRASAWSALGALLLAQSFAHAQGPAACDAMSVWDVDSGMCEAFPMAGMPMRMLMVHGNLFGTRIWEAGPRGQDAWAVPNRVMADLGTSLGPRHYLNLDVMLTAEKWLFPDRGYPLLTQIGETNAQGAPFIDDQHPHSSPIMGLTLSDTFSLEHEKDYLKFFFAPRGEATDGPVAFMHRTTAMVNPDAPLGHHIGQDVGHITSTVLGASLQLGGSRLEISTYHGAEPDPEAVDLPLGAPDSVSVRLIEQISADLYGMISAARVNAPEPNQPDIPFENRYSTSVYWLRSLDAEWTFYNSLIYGLITQYDHANYLSSFTEEFLVKGPSPRIWGRIEVLQRTASELAVAGAGNPNLGKWLSAATLGYTQKLAQWDGSELGLGGSLTKDFLPGAFIGAYGGNPWTGKIFLELSGMEMWGL